MNILPYVPLWGLLIMLLLIGIKAFGLKKRGVKLSGHPIKLQGKKAKNLLFAPFAFLFLLEVIHPVYQGELIPYLVGYQIFTLPVLQITGAVIIFLALIMLMITLVHFKNSLRFGLHANNSGRLITEGIFSYSRNPFFLSINLYFAGTALIFQSLLSFVFALAALVSIHFYILKEEKFM